MAKKSINQIFAENLKSLMEERGINQPKLSAMSNVSQKTISNFLNPHQRELGSKGKEPSAKLTELQMIADALGIDSWKMIRPFSPEQRAAYESIEAALNALQPKNPVAKPIEPSPLPAASTAKVANGKFR